MNNSNQGYHRQNYETTESTDMSNNGKNMPNKFVNELLGKDDYTAYHAISNSTKDSREVDRLFTQFKEQNQLIHDKAMKFKQIMATKYGQRNMTASDFVKKAKKYAKKANLSDAVFETFIKMVISEKNNTLYSMPYNEMSKTFNYVSPSIYGGKLTYSDKDMQHIQDILKIYRENYILYSHICLQTENYKEDDYHTVNASFDNTKHSRFTYIHPIIVALFYPKIESFEHIMLKSNIARLVKMKYEGAIRMYEPDVSLMLNMIHDPNVVNCVERSQSPLADLKARAIVQVKLWEVVLQMRQGKFYTSSMDELMAALTKCTNGAFDMPDLLLVRDEGTIMKRLLQAFSYRPTYVSFMPQVNWPITNQFAVEPSTLAPYQLTPLQMVTFRLPNVANKNQLAEFNITEHLSQPQLQWHYINKTPTLVRYNFIHSRDVLIIYIPRRYNTSINVVPFNTTENFIKFQTLSANISGIESLNNAEVSFDNTIELANDMFSMRSIVFLDTGVEKTITGVRTAILEKDDMSFANCVIYDPVEATKGSETKVFNAYNYHSNNANDDGVEDTARTHGTLFLYTKVEN